MARLRKLDYEHTAYFCEQLWLMVNTGMQLDDGLEILAEDMEDAALREICVFLAEKLNNGETLFVAMKECGVFPEHAVKMVEIGIVSGRLDEVLRALSEYYDGRAQTQQTVRYAVFHPSMLLVMVTIVVIVLVVKIIPMFSDIFSQFDAGIGSAVTDAVNLAYTTGSVMLVVMLVVLTILVVVVFVSPIRKAMLSFASVFPLTKGFSASFSLAKFTEAMCMMLTSGIDTDDALEYSLQLITDKNMKKKISDCLDRVRSGQYFADAICESGVLPKIYSRSLKIAYSSGAFDMVWRKISRRCGEESERALSNLISLVEPAIIVLLALVIGSVLMTIMLPLMNIMSALG